LLKIKQSEKAAKLTLKMKDFKPAKTKIYIKPKIFFGAAAMRIISKYFASKN